MSCVIVASSKNWFFNYPKSKEYLDLQVHEIRNKEDLNLEYLRRLSPKYIFFPHWNWIVPQEIYSEFECVVFHSAPLPYGRGGSPIQNLIIRGFKSTPVCALKMGPIVDGGPIYASGEISLEGTLSEIFVQIAAVVERLILEILVNNPEPKLQQGEPYIFRRLTESDNRISSEMSIREIYDKIRMLDSEGYPRANLSFGKYRLDFENASLKNNELICSVRIKHAQD